MKRILYFLMVLIIALAIQGCSGGTVLYEDGYGDSVRYKPESDLSYVRHLAPRENSERPGRKILD